jgi:lipopolysaccharide export system protein LptA
MCFLNPSFSDETKINSLEITANKNLEWDQKKNRITAQGNAQVKTNNFLINADVITGSYIGKIGKGNIKNLIAIKNAEFSSEETTIKANKIDYDFINDIIDVKGKNIEMAFEEGLILSEKSLTFYNLDKKVLVEGNVLIKINNKGNIKAEKVSVLINQKGEVSSVKAINNVEIFLDELEQNLFSDEAIFDNNASRIDLIGNIVLYYGESFLKGDRAYIDLKKGISKISSDNRTDVSGTFVK